MKNVNITSSLLIDLWSISWDFFCLFFDFSFLFSKVLGTCFVRKAMDYIFTQRELKWLDDIMPEATTREKEDREKRKNSSDEEEVRFHAPFISFLA